MESSTAPTEDNVPARGGTIFKVNTDGTGFSTVYSLKLEEGQSPALSALANGILFGTAPLGGENGVRQYEPSAKVVRTR